MFRPWFFVADGGHLYPKYTPVPSAIYAIGMALGEARISLALIAGGSFLLVYRLGTLLVDRTVGLTAAVLFAASPMALITTATFLPYAATTALNLVFAVLYLYSIRTESRPAAAGAGLAIGLSFFGRPFTALLFALPFIIHAGLATSVASGTEPLIVC
ncbi:MAG: glycosyltransferase family 39 protein [Natrialbaceae archaeon]|nr:glycosyltransferase family 39 protein [Natrialbaceae archaeon]